jgi:non-heme chloroperoxidase
MVTTTRLCRLQLPARKTARILKGAQLKVYKGDSHGLAQVDPETFNAHLLAFLRS